jgi:hypothetical protein
VCKSVHHRAIQINHNLMQQFFSLLSWLFLQLNKFLSFSSPSSGALWEQWQPLVLPSYRGDSCAVFMVEPASWQARQRTKHNCHQDMKVNQEAATTVIELVMIGGKTPETCWAVNKRQDNKLKNCCIRLWFIWIVRWCTDLQTLHLTFRF